MDSEFPYVDSLRGGASSALDGLGERDRLIERARDQQILVPDLLSLMPAWPTKIHPDVDEVNDFIDEWFKTVNIEEEKKIKHRIYGDYTILAAAYYPDCQTDKLFVLSKFLYWIFIWDDDIDTGGELTNDRQGTLLCCAKTKQCIDACLGPTPNYSAPPNSKGAIEMLYPILRELRTGLGSITMEHMRLNLHEYVDGVAKQQAIRQGDLPNPWEIFKMRSDDIGAKISITQVGFAMGFDLPEEIRKQESIAAIRAGCTNLCFLVNEVHSLQKEFRDTQLENLCLLFMNSYDLSLRGGIDKVLSLIREQYDLCVSAEARLPWSQDDEKVNDMIREYVLVCHRLATGTVYWSYNCKRYFNSTQLNDSMEVLLDLSLGTVTRHESAVKV